MIPDISAHLYLTGLTHLIASEHEREPDGFYRCKRTENLKAQIMTSLIIESAASGAESDEDIIHAQVHETYLLKSICIAVCSFNDHCVVRRITCQTVVACYLSSRLHPKTAHPHFCGADYQIGHWMRDNALCKIFAYVGESAITNVLPPTSVACIPSQTVTVRNGVGSGWREGYLVGLQDVRWGNHPRTSPHNQPPL